MNLFRKGLKYSRLRTLFVLGKIRGLYSRSQYCIKRGYRHRTQAVFFDDREMTDEYQDEVYQLAKFYADSHGYKKITDIGCGSGYKLMKYFSGYNTTGIEVAPTYDFLVQKYPGKRWLRAEDKNSQPIAADIIICADVIEHVENPDRFLEGIRKINFHLLFLSTPERDMVRGSVDYGPPDNKAHVREWNSAEFYQYVSRSFHILSHLVTHIEQGTQLLVCRPKTDDPEQKNEGILPR